MFVRRSLSGRCCAAGVAPWLLAGVRCVMCVVRSLLFVACWLLVGVGWLSLLCDV